MAELVLTLMHGAHNAFAVLDDRATNYADEDYRRISRLAAAELSVDGLLAIRDAAGYDAEMRIFNADGSESEMCGNGIRCVVRYLTERCELEPRTILTGKGPVTTYVTARSPEFTVRADLGDIEFPDGLVPQRLSAGSPFSYVSVLVGNPHAVVFVDDLAAIEPPEVAKELLRDGRFPSGVNAHVALRLENGALRVRHYERGVGETQACGSGAVACAAAEIAATERPGPIRVYVPGGLLIVHWAPGNSAVLEGPAEFIGDRALDPSV
jgi:diaminopimelate epimerase